MLFEVHNDKLDKCIDTWQHVELDIEKLIVSRVSEENPILEEDIFGEELFFVDRQITTSDKKRADIVAIDKNGSLVIIELKKDEGRLGVETQALQYLSNFSQLKGEDFINKYCKNKWNELNQFLNDEVDISDINKFCRIILIAQYFDRALFSMGKWLSDQGVSFKCIAYEAIQFEKKRLINFSIVFDQLGPFNPYRLVFSKKERKPDYFWHNIGKVDPDWWKYLITTNQISASFNNQAGDRGEEILKNYIRGDKIFAYANGIGCVGYGEIENPKYTLINVNSKENYFKNKSSHLHRLSINWIHTLDFTNAIKTSVFEKEYKIYHPYQTSSKIKIGNIEGLIKIICDMPHFA
jgi:hypothetical protein